LVILIIFGQEHKWSSSLCNCFQAPMISSLIGPYILLSTLFSYVFSPCSSLNVRD
jgi:hypothetical protein